MNIWIQFCGNNQLYMRHIHLYAVSLLGLLSCLALFFLVDDAMLSKLFIGLAVIFTLMIFAAFAGKAISNDSEQI